MKAKEIYELYYPYEKGSGGKTRPVLVFVLTSTEGRFIGLKITTKKRDQNRVEIKYWKEACISQVKSEPFRNLNLSH